MAKFIVRAKADISIEYRHKFLLDPKDFLDCSTEDEVRNKLDNLIWEAFDGAIIDDCDINSIDNTEYDNYIDDDNSVDDFLDEWQKLKDNDNSKSN